MRQLARGMDAIQREAAGVPAHDVWTGLYLQVGQDDSGHGLRGLAPALGVLDIKGDLRVLGRLIWIIYACIFGCSMSESITYLMLESISMSCQLVKNLQPICCTTRCAERYIFPVPPLPERLLAG